MIREEVVVQARQVGSPSSEKLDCGVDLNRERVLTLHYTQKLFLLLLEVVVLAIEVLDDLGRAIDSCQRGDVV